MRIKDKLRVMNDAERRNRARVLKFTKAQERRGERRQPKPKGKSKKPS